MKKQNLLFILILFSIKTLTSQILGIDTLIIFDKKYPLNRTNVSLVGNGNSFLSTTPCNYYRNGGNSYKYLTQPDSSCIESTSYGEDGNSHTENFCAGKRTVEDYLSSFADSLEIDYNKIKYSELKLKHKSKIYYFDIVEYILQYDTCKIKISFDQNAKSEYKLIHKSIAKFGKPRLIILNQLFYIEPKNRHCISSSCSIYIHRQQEIII